MAKKDITNIRGTIDFLKQEGEILTIKEPIDPILEKSAVLKALDNGPAFLFENTKGYPGVRSVANIFSRMDRVAKLFDVADPKQLKFKCLDAIKHPIPPVVVNKAPCQEVVITKDIDVTGNIPILKHTEKDGTRVMGSGEVLVSGRYARDGSCIAFKRMAFRGNDWGSIIATPGTHLEATLFMDHRDEDVPVTVNICTSPAVMIVAGGGGVHSVIPLGTNELAIAGGLEGSPIEICNAKTVDAFSIAKAEIVIEGLITTERVWETEEAEKLGKQDVTPFFPEWTGYLGRAWKSRKFQVTAITHRKDPIFYDWLGHDYESASVCFPLTEACFYELADRLVPGLVIDVHKPYALRSWGGVIYQVKKRRPRDEGYQRNILEHALSALPGMRLVIAVDEDVDIYSMDDVMWAIMSRADPATGFFFGISGQRGGAAMPIEQAARVEAGGFGGGLAIDATVPFLAKSRFERAHFPVNKIDLRKWLTQAEIDAARARQSEYAKCLTQRGW